jgi:hypothetical protein
MAAFHRADWLSLTQTVASLVAIGGAFGVVFLQHHLEQRREKQRRNEESARLVGMAAAFARDAYLAVGAMEAAKSNPLNTETGEHRRRDRLMLFQILESLNGIPIAQLATVQAARLLISVRDELNEAIQLAARDPAAGAAHDHVSCGEQYGLPYRGIWNRIREASELLKEEEKKFG